MVEEQLVYLGWYSNCTLLRNSSFHDVSFLCTKPLNIFLLQHNFPTDFKPVIECLFWVAAPEHCKPQFPPSLPLLRSFSCRVTRCVEMGLQIRLIHHFLIAPSFLSIVLVTWEMFKLFSSTPMLRTFTRFCCPDPKRHPQIPNISESSSKQLYFIPC